MRYEIQTLFANGEWQNPDGETFDTKAEADAELAGLIEDCEYSASMKYMEDFNAADWRVQECQYEGEEC
jgi:hypothetical protein